MPVSKELLEILACPKCKGDLTFEKKADKLVCNFCKFKFRIENGIPDLMVEEAETF